MKYNPMGIRGLCHFSIPVKDTEGALSFYEAIFGARRYRDEIGEYKFGFGPEDKKLGRQEHIFVEIADQRVELLGQDPRGQAPVGTHHTFAIGPNDVDAIVAHLRAHAVPFDGPATHRGTAAVSVYFADPDGNALEFCCWDGYPRLAEVPLLQQIERRDLRFTWDPAARRARPLTPA